MGKDREKEIGYRVQGKKKLVWFFLIAFTLFYASLADARPQRTAFEQAWRTLRKVEEMYASDHPQGKYTDNLLELAPYTNITSLLKDLGTGKFILELNNDKTGYTITVKGKDRCKTTYKATPDQVIEIKTQGCLSEQEIREITFKFWELSLICFPFAAFYIINRRYKKHKSIGTVYSEIVVFLFLLLIYFFVTLPNFMQGRE